MIVDSLSQVIKYFGLDLIHQPEASVSDDQGRRLNNQPAFSRTLQSVALKSDPKLSIHSNSSQQPVVCVVIKLNSLFNKL